MYLFGYTRSQLQHVGSSSLTGRINLGLLHWECSLSQWTTREVPTGVSDDAKWRIRGYSLAPSRSPLPHISGSVGDEPRLLDVLLIKFLCPFNVSLVRELVPRQVDKESWVPKERGVWNSQGGRKDKLFSFSTFLRII